MDTEDDVNEALHRTAREQRRLASRPYIDDMPDAVVEEGGKLRCKQTKNMRIIIERVSTILSTKPWLDTKTYIVNFVDQETGDLRLWDEELEHHASSNFRIGLENGYRFKVPPTKGPLLPRQKPEKPETSDTKPASQPKSNAPKGPTERRIYSTKGTIHTRIKGLAYVPMGKTKAKDGDRLLAELRGTALKVSHPNEKWEETWQADANL